MKAWIHPSLNQWLKLMVMMKWYEGYLISKLISTLSTQPTAPIEHRLTSEPAKSEHE